MPYSSLFWLIWIEIVTGKELISLICSVNLHLVGSPWPNGWKSGTAPVNPWPWVNTKIHMEKYSYLFYHSRCLLALDNEQNNFMNERTIIRKTHHSWIHTPNTETLLHALSIFSLSLLNLIISECTHNCLWFSCLKNNKSSWSP